MEKKEIEIIQDIYQENDKIAKEVNNYFNKLGILTINIMGAPGVGKTSVLIETIKRLNDKSIFVIEGDIESDIDTDKLKGLGIPAYQIKTSGACHLDAVMINKVLNTVNLKGVQLLFIENIGNLVCPAEFNIGEHLKIVICSITDGSDKPYKYPIMFEKVDAVILNKFDLVNYIDFDLEFFTKGLRALNKKAPLFKVSSKTGEGFDDFISWILNILTNSK